MAKESSTVPTLKYNRRICLGGFRLKFDTVEEVFIPDFKIAYYFCGEGKQKILRVFAANRPNLDNHGARKPKEITENVVDSPENPNALQQRGDVCSLEQRGDATSLKQRGDVTNGDISIIIAQALQNLCTQEQKLKHQREMLSELMHL